MYLQSKCTLMCLVSKLELEAIAITQFTHLPPQERRKGRHWSRPASMLSEKRDVSYEKTMNWICCRLSFALLRASIMSIRGARSSRHHPASEGILLIFSLLNVTFINNFSTFYFYLLSLVSMYLSMNYRVVITQEKKKSLRTKLLIRAYAYAYTVRARSAG